MKRFTEARKTRRSAINHHRPSQEMSHHCPAIVSRISLAAFTILERLSALSNALMTTFGTLCLSLIPCIALSIILYVH